MKLLLTILIICSSTWILIAHSCATHDQCKEEAKPFCNTSTPKCVNVICPYGEYEHTWAQLDKNGDWCKNHTDCDHIRGGHCRGFDMQHSACCIKNGFPRIETMYFSRPIINERPDQYLKNEVVDDRQIYVPIGYPVNIACTIMDRLKPTLIHSVTWASNAKEDEDRPTINQTGWHILVNATKHSPTVFWCTVATERGKFVARTEIIRQTCEKSEGDIINWNNPCRYGECVVDTGVLMCICFKQYTGLFCEQRKGLAIIWDIYAFYFPLAICILLCFLRIYFWTWGREGGRKQLMSLTDHIIPISRDECRHDRLYRSILLSGPGNTPIRYIRDYETETTDDKMTTRDCTQETSMASEQRPRTPRKRTPRKRSPAKKRDEDDDNYNGLTMDDQGTSALSERGGRY